MRGSGPSLMVQPRTEARSSRILEFLSWEPSLRGPSMAMADRNALQLKAGCAFVAGGAIVAAGAAVGASAGPSVLEVEGLAEAGPASARDTVDACLLICLSQWINLARIYR